MTRRRPTAEDLRILDVQHVDLAALTIEIDGADMTPPDWRAGSLADGIAHRMRLWEKYLGRGRETQLADADLAVLYALLNRNEHPVMAQRRQLMRERL